MQGKASQRHTDMQSIQGGLCLQMNKKLNTIQQGRIEEITY